MARPFVGLGATLLLALTLAACSGEVETPGEPAVRAGAAPVEEGAFPVEIEHEYGSTTIDDEPERIVVVGLKEQDDLLALGVVPVATTKWFDDTPGSIYAWAEDELGDAETPVSLSSDDGVEFERVAALEPDLILGLYAGLSKSDYETLSDIAPTIAQPAGLPDYGVGWQEELLTVGKAVGRPEAAHDIVDDVTARFAKVAEDHPEFEGTTALFATRYDGTYVYGSADPRSRLLTDLGFELPANIDQVVGTKDFGATISAERTDFLDTDVLVWLTNVKDDKDTILDDKVYTSLPVHENGRDIFVGDADDEEYGFSISFVTALSIPYTLDRLVPQLAAAVDGDRTTKVPVPED